MKETKVSKLRKGNNIMINGVSLTVLSVTPKGSKIELVGERTVWVKKSHGSTSLGGKTVTKTYTLDPDRTVLKVVPLKSW